MISTDDRVVGVLARRGTASAASDAITVSAASDARRASTGTRAVRGLSSIFDSLARWSSELLHHDTHQKENDDELD